MGSVPYYSLFITHQLPKGLHVDEAVLLGKEAINPVKDSIAKAGNESSI